MRSRRSLGLGWLLLGLGFVASAVAPPAVAEKAAFSTGKVSFAVEVRGETTPYSTLAVSVLPDATLPLRVVGGPEAAPFEARAEAGSLRSTGSGKWEWKAPSAAGLYPLTLRSVPTGEVVRLNVFVLVPIGRVRGEVLNGYRIGTYPPKPYKGLEIYRPPRGFIEVTETNADTPVSPHFTLRQFECKQAGGYPKYVVLRERLLLKLELLLEHVNAAGIRSDTFHVMSGYRTPYYNRAIGNVKYSRHVFGGAADVFVDQSPRDGLMDDLDGDDRIGVGDAKVLYDLIDALYGSRLYGVFVGGLGRYRSTSAHGPFVHVDVRGFRARWGN